MKTRIFTLLGLIAFTFSPVHADDVERFRDIIDTNDDGVVSRLAVNHFSRVTHHGIQPLGALKSQRANR
jgi:hypothetical protein